MLHFFSAMLRAMPLSWALAFGRGLGLFWYYVLPIRCAVGRENIRRALGDQLDARAQRRLLRRCLQNLCMYGIETLRVSELTPALIQERIHFIGEEHLEAARKHGKGIIFMGGHLDSWDLIICAFAMLHPPLHVVFKDIQWQEAQRFWTTVRVHSGIVPIAPRGSRDEIRRVLLARGNIVIPFDQHLPKHRAITCTFFGRPAATTPAPVRFAYETGATIVPCNMYRTDNKGHHHLEYEAPFVLESPYDDHEDNVRHNTQRLNDIFEKWIRARPEQWLWLHRRWKVSEHTRQSESR